MATKSLYKHLAGELESVKDQGLYKPEHVIKSPQDAVITLEDGREVINFCANNYLGLASHPAIVGAAREALDQDGFGMASVRFICGTQTSHKVLEQRLSDFLGMEDTIVYPSCFDANGGLFETLLTSEDAIISDALNHASIIDGIRLCKAQRFRYATSDMVDLEAKLQASQSARHRLIATDGVFSMDGTIANLAAICDLAEKYDALVMVDDCHATGFLGEKGKGSHEFCDVMGRVDIMTGTLGKALGGASGGYTSGKKEVAAWLRQRSRPYLFSNSLAPMIAEASIKALDLVEAGDGLRVQLQHNSDHFRKAMTDAGFDLLPGEHPIIPIMLREAKLAAEMAHALLDEGVYVIGFSYPVVPQGEARIRTQMSAAHTSEHIDQAVAAFIKVGRQLGVVT